jgi:hypothetical protein
MMQVNHLARIIMKNIIDYMVVIHVMQMTIFALKCKLCRNNIHFEMYIMQWKYSSKNENNVMIIFS